MNGKPQASEMVLVEGAGDWDFILAFLEKLGKQRVKAFPPMELGAKGNGIGNLLKSIDLLVTQIEAEAINRAAILIDADHAKSSDGGFRARRQQVTGRLAKAGYAIHPHDPGNATAGEIRYI